MRSWEKRDASRETFYFVYIDIDRVLSPRLSRMFLLFPDFYLANYFSFLPQLMSMMLRRLINLQSFRISYYDDDEEESVSGRFIIAFVIWFGTNSAGLVRLQQN
jgi:hypothetical protein